MFLGLLVLTVLFSAWLRRTKFGAGLVAIREDEGKAASIGVNTTRFKIVAYAASAFMIGTAGGVYAYYLTFINPVGSFAILGSVTIVLAALTGTADADAPTAALISLLLATDLIRKLFPEQDRRALKSRAKEVAESEWAGAAVKRAFSRKSPRV